ncbi:MAG: DMT family protein [Alphaproteobacteria bacterium]|nr:DMT family protein [Alphaproteobacteria bacterium]MBU0793140.1 DMT family protein [Alphaproteobacteria bacterium]MBU0874711.1 DMT family protein [Alphaproteobacteria bacterium]MBU1771535.1 DMT family protein [Alphaproteobacteria bacterium]
MPTIALLLASNILMTTAWYWHLKGGMAKPLALVILISWGIAFFEYCFAVPANRIGYASGWSAGQLKIAQEVIALGVFGIFMVAFLGEPLNWRHLGAFLCLLGAVAFLFWGKA